MTTFQTVKTKRITSANNVTGITVKATPGTLYGFTLFNSSAAKTYVKFYDATSITVGTTTPFMTIGINAASHRDIFMPYPMWFGTGIMIGITTGIADNDTTAPAANDVVGAVMYL